MNREISLQLQKDFPQLYKNLYGDPRQTCMAWGFAHGEGWYNIIREASEKITEVINKMPEEKQALFYADQVKEKFGTLRFYMSSYNEEIEKIIDEAERKSAITCDECGRPGTLGGKGWLATRCEEHKK